MKCFLRLTPLIIIILFLTAGCAFFNSTSGDDSTSVKTSDLVMERKLKHSLAHFKDSSAMEKYLKEAIRKQALLSSSYKDTYIIQNTNTTNDATAATNQEGGGTSVYSSTILQETGVDESDIIKTDGRYLYVVVKTPYSDYGFMEEGMTGTEGSYAVAATKSSDADANKIRVMELSDSPPSASEAAVISLDATSIVDSLYLINDRGEGLDDLLAVIGAGSGTPMGDWFEPWYWRNGNIDLQLFNVSNPAQPSSVISISIDGYIISSRRIGDTIYIVSRYTPYIEGFTTAPDTAKEEHDNASLLNNTSLQDMMPDISIDGKKTGELVNPDNCYLPPMPDDAVTTPDIITITAIDLKSPQTPLSSCIVGQAETVYVSTQSLYIATTRYNYSILPSSQVVGTGEPDVVNTLISYTSPETETDLHKFSLNSSGSSQPLYRGSGVVKGHLGWEQDKKSFRMGEKDEYIRIATSLGETWGSSSTTRLTILKESEVEGVPYLKEVATLPNEANPGLIGEPGERLYAARFLGDRAYLVTFRITDPLYVIDLSIPENPNIIGELKIKGYSDYLQPVGESMLLGIGKDAVTDSDGSGDGRGAWYQGIKLSLFNVSDPANPVEVNNIIIGKRGTDSDALIDHHAFAYIPPVDGKPARLALPVRLHETPTGNNTASVWDYYDWTHTALYLFDINVQDGTGITPIDKLIVEERSDENIYDNGYGYDRAVILNDSTHYIHEGKVWSALWSFASQATGPQ